MNEVYPCKVCLHNEVEHFIYTETHGWWEWLDDVGHEVWREEPYPRPVCNTCNNDCIFEPMTNLEYLEWCYDIRNSN
jgi:hypothetical protein